MSNINKAILVGTISEEPNFRLLNNGKAVLSFSLATSDSRMKDGLKVEEVQRHNIVLWRTLAEAGYKILKKNKFIYIEGKITTRHLVDKDGIKKDITEIVAIQFTLLGRNSDFIDDKNIDDFLKISRHNRP